MKPIEIAPCGTTKNKQRLEVDNLYAIQVNNDYGKKMGRPSL
jgi:hypothetical protein